eukprot:3038194-Ditylum_brightwellii.AAC.1
MTKAEGVDLVEVKVDECFDPILSVEFGSIAKRFFHPVNVGQCSMLRVVLGVVIAHLLVGSETCQCASVVWTAIGSVGASCVLCCSSVLPNVIENCTLVMWCWTVARCIMVVQGRTCLENDVAPSARV